MADLCKQVASAIIEHRHANQYGGPAGETNAAYSLADVALKVLRGRIETLETVDTSGSYELISRPDVLAVFDK